jgi:hypothetical protein
MLMLSIYSLLMIRIKELRLNWKKKLNKEEKKFNTMLTSLDNKWKKKELWLCMADKVSYIRRNWN